MRDTERLTPLLDSINDSIDKLQKIQDKLNQAKWQIASAKQQNNKLNIMLMKWQSEIEQSKFKIDKVNSEIVTFENITSVA
jgi:chromosome segregation ATPase